jgi:hypothetical protein
MYSRYTYTKTTLHYIAQYNEETRVSPLIQDILKATNYASKNPLNMYILKHNVWKIYVIDLEHKILLFLTDNTLKHSKGIL